MKTSPVKISSSLAMIAITSLLASQAKADHSPQLMIAQDAKQLHCLADDMHDEIKTHFKKARGYGKLMGLNVQVRSKSAAIARRIKRNPCYKGLDRDLSKLGKLTCELTEKFDEILRTGQCRIQGDTFHVVEKLAQMNELAAIMASVHANGIVLVENLVPAIAIPVQDSGLGHSPRHSHSVLER